MSSVNNGNPLLALPFDLLIDTVNELSDDDLAQRIPLICKGFLQVSREEKLWKKRTIQCFDEGKGNPSFEITKSWKATYIALRKLEMDKMMKRAREREERMKRCL